MAKGAKETRKRRAKARRSKALKVKVQRGPAVDSLETQIIVWESFAQTRSARATADATGIGRWIVTEILNNDRPRMLAMIDEFMESMVAQWEQAEARGHKVLTDLLALCEGMLAAIRTAAAAGTVTNILDSQGNPMSVLDAMQFMVMSRLMDQIINLNQKARAISTAYRGGVAVSRRDDDTERTEDFATMDDMALARAIRAGGLKLPPILERKIAQLEAAPPAPAPSKNPPP